MPRHQDTLLNAYQKFGRNLLSKLMKLEPVPKIFGHLDMKAAIKWILVLEMVLLFISGCSQPVRILKSVYIKDWEEKTLVAVSLQVSGHAEGHRS